MGKIILSCFADKELIKYFLNLNYSIELSAEKNCVYKQIAAHPDVFMCKLGTDPNSQLLYAEDGEVGEKYPADIAFNAVCTGKFFIHNLRYTNKRLQKAIKQMNLTEINVNQGYTKCSTVIVDDCSFITEDEGLYSVLRGIPGISVLKVSKGYVKLDGFTYGFLGGASGRVGDTIVFNGNLSAHPDFEKISSFINSKGLKIMNFESYPLTDIGSIIETV
ncbi:MAG: hypothetical protein IJL87_09500 [Clostridia bacterium]|nr:hypothetical protein [Clostridia bacterium]